MFGRIQIIEDLDDLNRVVYDFWLDKTDLYLDKMLVESRESRRHKFKIDFSSSYSRIYQRSFGIKEEPEIDIDIQVDAVNEARKKITFKTWRNK